MKKMMLITGASSGLGFACSEWFKDSYNLITISRKLGHTEVGDIKKEDFRNYIVKKYTPDVVINNAGMMMEVKFYNKLNEGSDIINVSSVASTSVHNWGQNATRLVYNSTKSALSDFTIGLAKSKKKDVRVSVLEPATIIPTNFHDFTKRSIPETRYTEYNFQNETPLRPGDVVKIIEWMIDDKKYSIITT
jgi:NADP-dependent 3-hydroxy acid dehydrogenase YdfG